MNNRLCVLTAHRLYRTREGLPISATNHRAFCFNYTTAP